MENNTTTHEFETVRTIKRTGHVSRMAYHVEISSAELPESVKNDRWYKVLAPFITKVEQWAVQSDIGGHAHNWAEKAKLVWPDRTFVVHTKFGTATIVMFRDGSAIQGITVHGRKKAKAYTLGTWRKYGHKRGHGMQQLRAAAGMGLCSSPEAGRDICEWEAVGRLTSAFAGEADHRATSALYAAVEGKAA